MKQKKRHSMNAVKFMPYHVCGYCGLIGLHNKKTRKALNKPCTGTQDDE